MATQGSAPFSGGGASGAPYPDSGYSAINLSQSWICFFTDGQSNNNQSKVKNKNPINPAVKIFNSDFSGANRINAWENSEDSSHAKTGADLLSALGRSASWQLYHYKGGQDILKWTGGAADNLFDVSQTIHAEAISEATQSGLYPMFGFWYQGEADISPSDIPNYPGSYAKLLNLWRVARGYVAVFQVQLAPVGKQPNAGWAEALREVQRQQETGAGFTISQNKNYLVCAHDLTLWDIGEIYHLSGFAKQELGKRFALAVREKVFGQAVDGTGPRISSTTRINSSTVEITFDRNITAPTVTTGAAYDNYFRVTTSGGTALAVSSITRTTATKVQIAHAANVGGIKVIYQPPMIVPTQLDPPNAIAYPNCIRGVTADALPTPAFTVGLA